MEEIQFWQEIGIVVLFLAALTLICTIVWEFLKWLWMKR